MELGKFWVITRPTGDSTLADICFETDANGLILQAKGGLERGDIVATFTEKREAESAASALLRERARAVEGMTDRDRRVTELLWDAITEPRLRDRASALLKEMMGEA